MVPQRSTDFQYPAGRHSEKILSGFTLYQFDDHFRCTKRIDAREVKWMEGKWWFYDGMVRDFDEAGATQINPFQELQLPLGEDWILSKG